MMRFQPPYLCSTAMPREHQLHLDCPGSHSIVLTPDIAAVRLVNKGVGPAGDRRRLGVAISELRLVWLALMTNNPSPVKAKNTCWEVDGHHTCDFALWTDPEPPVLQRQSSAIPVPIQAQPATVRNSGRPDPR